jgi:hypothetical protein
MLKPLTITLFLFISLYVKASISIIDAQGWLETAWVKWQLPQGNSELRYNVYVSEADKDSWTKLDDQLVRNYGNYGRMLKADADQHKKPVSVNGKDLRVDTDYKIACVGQDLLLHFLKTYLGMGCGFDYKNGVWVKKDNAADDEFVLEKIKNYFTGDVSEIREAIAFQPNNKIKLLYGVKTSEDGKEYQSICMRDRFILRSSANETAIAKMDADLQDAYNRGSFSNITYKVQPLAEYEVEPTDLSSAPSGNKGSEDSDALPWD